MAATIEQSGTYPKGTDDGSLTPQPGLLLVFSGRKPLWCVVPLVNGEIELGRDSLAAHVQDGRISRSHARIFLRGGRFYGTDLGSRNGTSIDGKSLVPMVEQPIERCLRIGDTLFLVADDVNMLARNGLVVRNGRVLGPRLLEAYLSIGRAGSASSTLHVTGESGVGKEDAARAFHAATAKSNGPFIGVNCATIPESIAERLLFGAKRGAFSGAAADAEGYLQAAHGGTLFLDEVAELNSAVQAKLLRVLENREVQALGAVRPTPVEIRVCSASHMSLRSQVALGRLREDLYYRIGRPEVVIPPLRERLEEIPWLIDSEISKASTTLVPHYSFVEACLLRHWPGNIRELLVEVRAAVQEATASASQRLEAKHLSATAGQDIKKLAVPAPVADPAPESSSEQAGQGAPPSERPAAPSEKTPVGTAAAKEDISRDKIEDVLRRTGGNVSKAARVLGLHRTALRRLLERYQIDPSRIPGIL